MNSSNDQLVRSFMNTLEIQQKAWESLWIYQTQEPVMFALKGTLYKVGLYISVDLLYEEKLYVLWLSRAESIEATVTLEITKFFPSLIGRHQI